MIKLGAAGDVLRTTPILHPIRKKFPGAEITWVTQFPAFVQGLVDRVVALPPSSSLDALHAWDFGRPFDVLYSLDKDLLACAIASHVEAKESWGFTLRDGCCLPINGLAQEAWEVGLWDPLSRANRKNYPQMLFEMCGFSFQGEPYVMVPPKAIPWAMAAGAGPVVGLNIGCGERWLMRLWPDRHWEELATGLRRQGYAVLILGGPQEQDRAQSLAEKTGAVYPGARPLEEFISWVNRCDAVVTSVSMALHIALGLKKRVVLLNNIFNRHEFELYGLGEILEPAPACECYYPSTCDRNCMARIRTETVLQSCLRQLKRRELSGVGR